MLQAKSIPPHKVYLRCASNAKEIEPPYPYRAIA
jgi:hypothetical protein